MCFEIFFAECKKHSAKSFFAECQKKRSAKVSLPVPENNTRQTTWHSAKIRSPVVIAFLIVVVGVNMSTNYFYLLMHMPFLVILMCRDHSYCILIHVHRNVFVMSVLTYLFYRHGVNNNKNYIAYFAFTTGDRLFAECQVVSRVLFFGHSTKTPLPSVFFLTLGKELLCRVLFFLHSVKKISKHILKQ